VFVEHGFTQASVTEIAERAGISGPAVYKHFDDKADLFIEAARSSLDDMFSTTPSTDLGPVEVARRWLADDFARTRRLLLELHLAASRDTDVAGLLAEWHVERARQWQHHAPDGAERIKAFYLLLLGLAHLDTLSALPSRRSALQEHVDRMVRSLFDDAPDR
jgi:AcrR family transcriptional regulator